MEPGSKHNIGENIQIFSSYIHNIQHTYIRIQYLLPTLFKNTTKLYHNKLTVTHTIVYFLSVIVMKLLKQRFLKFQWKIVAVINNISESGA